MGTIKIAVTGSIRWEDRKKVKDSLFSLKKKVGPELEIISGGMDGIDMTIRKCCMELEIDYKEIPPSDRQWSHHCIDPPFMFGKPFKKTNIYSRNTKIVNECQYLIMFKIKDDDSLFLDNLIMRFQKKNKKILIIN